MLLLSVFFLETNSYFSDVHLSCNMSEAIKLMPDMVTDLFFFKSAIRTSKENPGRVKEGRKTEQLHNPAPALILTAPQICIRPAHSHINEHTHKGNSWPAHRLVNGRVITNHCSPFTHFLLRRQRKICICTACV